MIRTRGIVALSRWAVEFGLTFLILATAAGPTRAAEPRARVSLAGTIGVSSYSMSDVNNRIDAGNQYLKEQGWDQLGDLKSGYNFTGDLRIRLTGPFSLSLGAGTTSGRSRKEFDQIFTVDSKTPFYQAAAVYRLPIPLVANTIFRVGAGPVYAQNAVLNITHEVRTVDAGTTRTESAQISGKGWGARAFLEGEMILNSRVTLVADVGYRQLSISQRSWSWNLSPALIWPANSPDPWQTDVMFKRGNGGQPNDWLTTSFLSVSYGPDAKPIVDNNGVPILQIDGPGGSQQINMDFSGVTANIGFRFYIF